MNKTKKQKLISFIKNNKNGFTINYKTLEEIKKGYAVSFTHTKKAKNLNLLLDNLDLFINMSFSHLKNNICLGGWFNDDDKNYYIDLVLNINDEKKALIIGQQFKQIAIYNLNTNKEVFIKNE
jgi:hypothetical protein